MGRWIWAAFVGGAIALAPLHPAPAPVADREIQGLVDQLAQMNEIEGPQIGEGGDPSVTYGIYRRLSSHLDEEAAIALLQHPSPIVRGYMIEDVAKRDPAHAEKLLGPLREDQTGVWNRAGCGAQLLTIGEMAEDAIARTASEERVVDRFEYIRRLGDSRSYMSRTILQHFAKNDDDPNVRTAALAVLDRLPSPDGRRGPLQAPQR